MSGEDVAAWQSTHVAPLPAPMVPPPMCGHGKIRPPIALMPDGGAGRLGDRGRHIGGLLRARDTGAGEVHDGVEPNDLLKAVGRLCMHARDESPDITRRLVDLVVDGIRSGARAG